MSVSPTLSPAESTTSLSGGGPLQVGDRVIVASSMAGTKTGTLRYLGPTDFAKGEWAGIELDAGIGKNDGTVDGKRYFECAANFGLFAPLHKVTKSPKMRMMKPSALTPGKLRRESSTLSNASTAASSVARSLTTPVKSQGGLVTPATVKSNTTALKETLRDKDQYIEQLLKERDLERAEVAKAANQTDEVESKLIQVQQILSICKTEMAEVTKEKETFKVLLDEEKRKVDDLQFQLEEQQILAGGDGNQKEESENGQSSTELQSFRTKICELESVCSELRKDKETWLTNTEREKSEIEEGRKALENQLDQQKNVFEEKIKELTEENEKNSNEAGMVKELRDKMAILNKELTSEQKRSENFEIEANKVFEAEEQMMMLNEELAVTKKSVEVSESNLEVERKRTTDLIEAAKNADFEASEKIVVLETDLKARDNSILDLEHQIQGLKGKFEDIETKFNSASGSADSNKKEIQELKSVLRKAEDEVQEKTSKVEELLKKLETSTEELTALKEQLGETHNELKKKEGQLTNKDKEIASLQGNIAESGSDYQVQVQTKIQEISQLNSRITELDASVLELQSVTAAKDAEVDRLTAELASARGSLEHAVDVKSSSDKEITALKDSLNSAGEQVERLNTAVAKRETDLETANQTIQSLQTQTEQLNADTEQMKSLHSKEIEEKMAAFDTERDNLAKSSRALEDDIQKLKKAHEAELLKQSEALKSSEHEKETEMKKLEKKCVGKDKKIADLEGTVEKLKSETASASQSTGSLVDNLRSQIETLEAGIKEKETDVSTLQGELTEKEATLTETVLAIDALTTEKSVLKTQVDSLKPLEIEVASIKESLENLNREKLSLEEKLSSALAQSTDTSTVVETLTQSNSELNSTIAELRSSLTALKETQAMLENEKQDREVELCKEIEDLKTKQEREGQRLATQLEQVKQTAAQAEDRADKQTLELKAKLESTTKEKACLISEHELKVDGLSSDLGQVTSQLDIANEDISEKCDKIESLQWKNNDLEKEISRLRETHQDELGDLVDAVNDLKLKEDELNTVQKTLTNQTRKMDELCKQLLGQEQQHKDTLKKREAEADKRVAALETKLSESKDQAQFLKEQAAGHKVEMDLQMEKLRMEHEAATKASNLELDQKILSIKRLKDDLAAKEEELEFTKEELQEKKDELDELNTDLDIKEASFSNEHKEIEEAHREEVEILVSKNETLSAKIGELSEKIALQTSEYDSKIDEIMKAKKTEVGELKDRVSGQEAAVLDLEMQVRDAEARTTSLQAELRSEADLASTKLGKLSAENESLRRSKYELETSVKNVGSERDHIVHLNEDLSIRIVEFEVQVKEMKSQYQSLQVNYEKQSVELSEKQEMMSQGVDSLADLENLLSQERSRVDTLQVSVNDLESERDQLAGQAETLAAEAEALSSVHQANTRLEEEVKELTRKNEFLFEELAKERLRLESKLTTLAEKLEKESQERLAVAAELEATQSENNQLSSYKRQVLMLEQEKKELETQLVTLTVESRLQKPRAVTPVDDGGENLQGQVDFLNSVIVDMQKKNDELKSKLELLENAGILDDSTEFFFNGVSSRQPAPRLFCDICDEFDIHDTEDCPKQATVVEEISNHSKHGGKRKPPAPRPYCDTCEMFGHDTVDCNDNETF